MKNDVIYKDIGEKMSKLFQPELTKIVDGFESKSACLDYMTRLLSKSGCLAFPDRFLAAVRGREDIMSTGIGRSVAIPHARDLTVSALRTAVCLLRTPLDYESVDDQPVRIIFMIAVPQNSNKDYMKILRSLSEYLRQDDKRELMLNAKNEMELYNEIIKIEDDISDSLHS
jgi:mannitol/fructose-specific phosphotransferase system IIA component (Ntr-type)